MTDTKRFNFTKAALEALPSAAPGQRDTYFDVKEPALSIRVTENGKKSFRVRGRPRGQLKVETLTIGPFPAVPIERARTEAKQQVAAWAGGASIAADKKAEADAERVSITFGEALKQYVEHQTRGKDKKPLKQRTRDDYLAMAHKPEGESRRKAGPLAPIAGKPLASITADDIRKAWTAASASSTRTAVYAMQVLRAVLNWHGVRIEGNPLDKTTAGRDRIRLTTTAGAPSPIPAERLGAWWLAATAPAEGLDHPDEAADYLAFLLLTGCRSIEVKGARRGKTVYGEALTVGAVDVVARRMTLRDTKNRSDHIVHLSTQALEIVKRRVKGKTPAAPLFTVSDPRKRLQAINEAAGVSVSPHDLRATFASVAEELVSTYTLKRMMNHANGGDVTGGHYVAKSDAQLRAGWQTVADAITELAAVERAKRENAEGEEEQAAAGA